MTILRSFKAIRPKNGYENKVAALPYDVLNSYEAKENVVKNPYSFLHIDKAEIDLPEYVDLYDRMVYEKAKDNLENMIKKEIFIKEDKKCLYIYKIQMGEVIQTGIVGCVSVDDYLNNVIKKHEKTREEKEIDRTNHVAIVKAHTGPIFLTYKYNNFIDNMMKECEKNEPLYNFQAEDKVKHTIWKIDEEDLTYRICKEFENVPEVYIADGHHRAASAVNVALNKRKELKNYTGEEEFNFFLAVLFPHDSLKVMDYNRVLKDTLNYSGKELIEKIKEKFHVNLYKENKPYKPEKKHYFGMYINNKWYELKAREGTFDKEDIVGSLDVSILQNNLLYPILKIQDPRKDNRIDFVGGIRGLKELEKIIDAQGKGVAFSMYPTSVEELMGIADEGEVMPPKSTWFEPKLRSGLFIHEF
ncbi:DUF1015 domain-containing protein [Clostridium niameyense]|uniref:DUF1015 domain-containing protein n=1 Tax=Clostridium niameyense TaxID=1622073 RepID=UPI00067F2269|nr:DUF1015 family protein [Clostridium niameyense]